MDIFPKKAYKWPTGSWKESCITNHQRNANQNHNERELPGGPVTKTPGSQCRGPGLDPWSQNWSHMLQLGVHKPQLKILQVVTKTWHSQINK